MKRGSRFSLARVFFVISFLSNVAIVFGILDAPFILSVGSNIACLLLTKSKGLSN